MLIYFGFVETGYAGSFFTPTILHQLGWSAVRAQVMTIPIYITATVICLSVALVSDAIEHRFGFVLLGCVVATAGYTILINQVLVSTAVRYFALFLITSGGFIAQPVAIVWLNNNMGGHYKRGIAAALQVGLGNIGGLVASNVYITTEAPLFPTGFGVSLGCLWVSGVAACAFFLVLFLENRKRGNGAVAAGTTPAYRYVY